MRNVKIALSASYWNVPPCRALLMLCDRIYTSNAGACDELQKVFGADKIKVMTDAMPSTIKRVKHEELESASLVDAHVNFVTYSDLHAISTRHDESMDIKDEEIAALKLLFEDRNACLTQRDSTIEILMRDVRQLKDARIIGDHQISTAKLTEALVNAQHDRDIARVRDLEATLEAKDLEIAKLKKAAELNVEITELHIGQHDRDIARVRKWMDLVEARDREIVKLKDTLFVCNHQIATADKIEALNFNQRTRDMARVRDLEATLEAKDLEIQKQRDALVAKLDVRLMEIRGDQHAHDLLAAQLNNEDTSLLQVAKAELDFLRSLQPTPEIPQALDTSVKHWESLSRVRDLEAALEFAVGAKRLSDLEAELLVEDQRRLNYLIKMGVYKPASKDTGEKVSHTEWTIFAPPGTSLREQLDRLREGLLYDENNVPISPHGGPARTLRDPMDQDHSV